MLDDNIAFNPSHTPLSQIQVGAACRVAALHLEGLMRRRLMDMGITPGTAVECIRRGPSGDPIAYAVRGTTIALRQEDAAKITVYKI